MKDNIQLGSVKFGHEEYTACLEFHDESGNRVDLDGIPGGIPKATIDKALDVAQRILKEMEASGLYDSAPDKEGEVKQIEVRGIGSASLTEGTFYPHSMFKTNAIFMELFKTLPSSIIATVKMTPTLPKTTSSPGTDLKTFVKDNKKALQELNEKLREGIALDDDEKAQLARFKGLYGRPGTTDDDIGFILAGLLNPEIPDSMKF